MTEETSACRSGCRSYEEKEKHGKLTAIRIPMRDGVELSADIYLPVGCSQAPAVLLRTPYSNAESEYDRYGLRRYTEAGYAVVFQTVRGRGQSDGEFGFFFVEADDGYDTIEWIAAQPWSDGKVAMDGGSYLGTVQWLAARARPPHLVCIIPSVPAGDYFNEVPYLGGALHLDTALAWQAQLQGVQISFTEDGNKNLEYYRPLSDADKKLGLKLPLLREFLAHPCLDDYWKRIYFGPEDFRKIDLPVMTFTGWYDGDQAGSLFYWQGLENNSAYRKENGRLVIGPWLHHECYLGGSLQLGELVFDENALYPLAETRLAFLNAFMKGRTEDFELIPRVQVYMTGSNQWHQFDEYPPAQVEYKSLFLSSKGHANSRHGDGVLRWQPPPIPAQDNFIYDPLDPVPYSLAGSDNRLVEERQDILVYTSEPLSVALEIIGPISLNVYASSDALDTDFIARLVDVFPDGRAVNLTHTRGVIRARYRNGYEVPELLEPGNVELFNIRLTDLAHSFLPGHCVRLEITSSSFPLIEPNPNTGGNSATEITSKQARQKVYHDRDHPSCLILPVFTKAT